MHILGCEKLTGGVRESEILNPVYTKIIIFCVHALTWKRMRNTDLSKICQGAQMI